MEAQASTQMLTIYKQFYIKDRRESHLIMFSIEESWLFAKDCLWLSLRFRPCPSKGKCEMGLQVINFPTLPFLDSNEGLQKSSWQMDKNSAELQIFQTTFFICLWNFVMSWMMQRTKLMMVQEARRRQPKEQLQVRRGGLFEIKMLVTKALW